jgi:hypothetical protein
MSIDAGGSSSASESKDDDSYDPLAPENLQATIAEMQAEEAAESGRSQSSTAEEGDGDDATEGDAAEADDAKKEAGAGTSTDNSQQAKKLAGTFEKVEDLEKAYTELRAKMSSTRPVVADNTDPGAAQGDNKPDDPNKPTEKKTHSQRGFPLDEYGIEVIPASVWQNQRLDDWVNWHKEQAEKRGIEIDDADARAYARISLAEEYDTYKRDYGTKREEAAQRQATEEGREIARLQPLQREEMTAVETALKKTFATMFPEEGATAITETLFGHAKALVRSAVENRVISIKEASHPNMVRLSLGEVLKQAAINGTLEEIFAKGNVAAKGGGGGEDKTQARVKEPPIMGGNGSSGGSGGGGGNNGTVRKTGKVTPEAVKFAQSLGITPEEAQAEIEAIRKES